MLSDQAMFLKANIDVGMLKEYLFKTQALRAKMVKEDQESIEQHDSQDGKSSTNEGQKKARVATPVG
jgi:hypothetical protein